MGGWRVWALSVEGLIENQKLINLAHRSNEPAGSRPAPAATNIKSYTLLSGAVDILVVWGAARGDHGPPGQPLPPHHRRRARGRRGPARHRVRHLRAQVIVSSDWSVDQNTELSLVDSPDTHFNEMRSGLETVLVKLSEQEEAGAGAGQSELRQLHCETAYLQRVLETSITEMYDTG